jgi:hypothetical protein
MRPARYAYVAGVLFAAEAAFAIVHRLAGGRYPGFTHTHDVVIDLGLAVIWSAAAVACLIHRSWPAFVVAFVGSAVSVIHGVMFSVALTHRGPYGVGIPFLIAATVQFYCAVHDAPAFLEGEQPSTAEPRRRFAFLRPRQVH